MIRKILLYPDNKDILTQKSKETTYKECKKIIQDLKDTLHSSNKGVGISAVQIGELKRCCVIKYNNQDIVLINPIITRRRGKIKSGEGCLSVPDKFGIFERAEKVWCTYTDENGKEKEIATGGLLSRIIQHELDHFEGWCNVFDIYEEINKTD